MTEDRELQRMNRDERMRHYITRAESAETLHKQYAQPEPGEMLTITINSFAAEKLTRKVAELARVSATTVELNDRMWDRLLTQEEEEQLEHLNERATAAAFVIAELVAGYLLD